MSKIIPWLPAVQIALSILLALCILIQNRGSAVGSTFGGSGTIYRTKRGIEKTLFQATIILGVVFSATSIIRIAFS